MKIRDIGFAFGFRDWTTDGQVYHQRLRSRSMSLMIYVQQRLSIAKIESDLIDSIWFRPVENCVLLAPQLRGTALYIDVPIYWDQFGELSDADAINALFCDLHELGFTKIPARYNVPVDVLRNMVSSFRDGGFVNEWQFKKRHYRARNVKAELNCSLDTEHFRLSLIVWQNGIEVFNDVILKTGNDPIFYHNEFKDLKLVDGYIIISRRQPNLIDGVLNHAPFFQWALPVLRSDAQP